MRPHAKIHKSTAIALRQIALGAVGQCVQKVGAGSIHTAPACVRPFLARHQKRADFQVGCRLCFPHLLNGLTSIQAEVIGQRADEAGAERSTRPFQGPASIPILRRNYWSAPSRLTALTISKNSGRCALE